MTAYSLEKRGHVPYWGERMINDRGHEERAKMAMGIGKVG